MTSKLKPLVAALVLGAALTAQAQDAVRPDIGKPLQAAGELIKAGKYKEALAKVRDADAVPNKNASESYTIERMRIAAASGAGDADTAGKSFEALAATGKLAQADKLRMLESLAGTAYRAKDYAKTMQWGQRYFKEGGTSGTVRTLLIQSQYLGGDFAGAARELQVEINVSEKAGQAPAEDRLKLLANATQRMNDTNAYVWAVEKLVTYYPQKQYWTDLLGRLQRKPNFSDRLALDTYRLSLATGATSAAADYMEMVQLAVQAGSLNEAQQAMDKGFAAGVLGVGPEAERHKRLKDLVAKRLAESKAAQAQALTEAKAAKDGGELLAIGMDQVYGGQAKAGLELMQQGIAKGTKRPDDAKLHLAIAQLVAGDHAKSAATFKTVQGNDGTADLARLWALYARKK
jgi:outer membrane protein assembly factor BamD (BamD/ComL family)